MTFDHIYLGMSGAVALLAVAGVGAAPFPVEYRWNGQDESLVQLSGRASTGPVVDPCEGPLGSCTTAESSTPALSTSTITTVSIGGGAILLVLVVVGSIFGRKRAKSGVEEGTLKKKGKDEVSSNAMPVPIPGSRTTPPPPERNRSQSMSGSWKDSILQVMTTKDKSKPDPSDPTSPSTPSILRRSLSSLRTTSSSETVPSVTTTPADAPPLPADATSNVRTHRLTMSKPKDKGKQPEPPVPAGELSSDSELETEDDRIRIKMVYGPPPRFTGGSSQWNAPIRVGTTCKAVLGHRPQETDEMMLRRGELVVVDAFYEDAWVLVHIDDPMVRRKPAAPSRPSSPIESKSPSRWAIVGVKPKKEKVKKNKKAPSSLPPPKDERKYEGMVPWHCLTLATEDDIAERTKQYIDLATAAAMAMPKSPLQDSMQHGMFAAKMM